MSSFTDTKDQFKRPEVDRAVTRASWSNRRSKKSDKVDGPMSRVVRLLLPGLEVGQGKVALRCILALMSVLLFGTVGFRLIEQDWNLWDSLYFTLITITTVGYGDEGLSPAGQKLATVLLLVGIGTATYSLGVLMQIAVSSQLAWKQKMQKQIDRLSDHIVVCGFGRIGKTTCERLTSDGVGFVVVENDEQAFQAAIDHGFPAIHGTATEDDILRSAGVERARGVVCAVNSDAENVFISLSARDLNASAYIVCRAEAEGTAEKVQRAGASMVISPHFSAGLDIATAILRPNVARFLQHGRLGDDEFELSEVSIDEGSPLAGQTIRQFGQSEDSIVFVAIERPDGQRLVRPGGDETFRTGDVVIVAGHPEDLSRMYRAAQGA